MTYNELRAGAEAGLVILVQPCVMADGEQGIDYLGFRLTPKYQRRAQADGSFALSVTLTLAEQRREELVEQGITFV